MRINVQYSVYTAVYVCVLGPLRHTQPQPRSSYKVCVCVSMCVASANMSE